MNIYRILIVTAIILITWTLVPSDNVAPVKRTNNQPIAHKTYHPVKISNSIKTELKKQKLVSLEIQDLVMDAKLNFNYEKRSAFIIKYCEVKSVDKCLKVCVNVLDEPIPCEIEQVEKESLYLCLDNNMPCDRGAGTQMKEIIVSNQKTLIEQNQCYARSKNCKKDGVQSDTSEENLGSILTHRELNEYKEDLYVLEMQKFISKSSLDVIQELSLCVSNELPQSVESLKQLKENDVDYMSVTEGFIVCLNKFKNLPTENSILDI